MLYRTILHGRRTRVELRVDGLDEPLLRSAAFGVLDDLEDDDAGDLLGLLAGALGEPADGDLSSVRHYKILVSKRCEEWKAYAVAVVPEVQDLEGNGRLSTLARLERCAGVEDCRAELQGSWKVSIRCTKSWSACQPCRLQTGMGRKTLGTGTHTAMFWLVVQAPLISSITESE